MTTTTNTHPEMMGHITATLIDAMAEEVAGVDRTDLAERLTNLYNTDALANTMCEWCGETDEEAETGLVLNTEVGAAHVGCYVAQLS